MPASQIDRVWFDANPDRLYRLRHQTPAEIAVWPNQLDTGWRGWCVIRRCDGVLQPFGLSDGRSFEDSDRELAALFDTLVKLSGSESAQ